MDFKIDTQGADGVFTFEKATNYANNVYLSLSIEQGSLFFLPKFGSRLHLLPTLKNTADTEAKAQDYVKEALQWMFDIGRLKAVKTQTERIGNRLHILVEATESRGQIIVFKQFFEVL